VGKLRDTILAKIIRLVQQAQTSRPLIQRLADAVSGLFVPTVIAAAGMTFGAGPSPASTLALVAAVVVLTISLPLPTSVMSC
jgi:P-type Cu+ transporter